MRRGWRAANGSAAGGALHGDRAAEGRDELAADGQPQPGVVPGGVGGDLQLGEGKEQALQLVGGDAETGVGDGELQQALPSLRLRGSGLLRDLHRALDAAGISEADGVADQGQQNLAQPDGVGDDGLGQLRRQHQGQVDRLGQGEAGGGGDGLLQQGAQPAGGQLQGEMAGLDAGEVEDAVEQGEQGFPRTAGDLEALPLLGRELRGQHQPGHADDPVERGADLMAEGGEEGAPGPFGGPAGR